ncbi:MAG: hypothetical protein PF487_12480, partial [Bacteroidales bacterium]|nr:hypothetical protein [Bacteroidales bacterium]
MGKKLHNSFDILVENFKNQFSQIKNFDLMINDEKGNKIFNTIIYRFNELTSFMSLMIDSYIPATKKAITRSKNIIRSSSYSSILNNNQIDFEESIYEVIRFGYVNLFHKLENYINEIVTTPDRLFGDTYEDSISVSKWAEEKYNFKLKDWRQFKITSKINWICNCVKHYDGYPTKTPKPAGMEIHKEDIRIRIGIEEFKEDCDILINLYPALLQTMMFFGQHKMMNVKSDYGNSDEYFEKQKNLLKQMEIM